MNILRLFSKWYLNDRDNILPILLYSFYKSYQNYGWIIIICFNYYILFIL